MADMRPMAQRAPEFKIKLVELCKEYRIEILATIASTPTAIVAQIRFIDVNNAEELKNYGLSPVSDEKKDNESSLLVN